MNDDANVGKAGEGVLANAIVGDNQLFHEGVIGDAGD